MTPERNENKQSTREKSIEFAKARVPKPKIAKNPEQLMVKNKSDINKTIISHSPQKDEFSKLLQNHDMYSEELHKLKQEY